MVKLSEFSPARVGGPGSVTHTGPYAHDGGKSVDTTGNHSTIVTFTGYPFDLCDHTTWTYDHLAQQNDIAHALSTITRFGGHTHFYSVAEHSIRVSRWLEDKRMDQDTQLLGLWHDAAEAYIGDVPRPQKKLMLVEQTIDPNAPNRFMRYEELEDLLAHGIWKHFGIPWSEERWAAVKSADYAVYEMERDERPYPATVGKHAMTPKVAETLWQTRNALLRKTMNDG